MSLARTTVLTLLLPGLGHYHAGASLKSALSVFGLSSLAALLLLDLLPIWLPWRTALVVITLTSFVLLLVMVAHARGVARRHLAARVPRRGVEYLAFMALAVVVVIFLSGFEAILPLPQGKTFSIPTVTMEPTLLPGDRIRARLGSYRGAKVPSLGDVVVFHSPRDPKTPYVKRVVGMPGDRINIRSGAIERNGALIAQRELDDDRQAAILHSVTDHSEDKRVYEEWLGKVSYFVIKTAPDTTLARVEDFPEGGGEYTVKNDEYFVVGDNRDNSFDSRNFGGVPAGNLIGRVEGVIVSIGEGGQLRPERTILEIGSEKRTDFDPMD